MMCKNIEFKEFHVDIILGSFRHGGEFECEDLKKKLRKLKDGSVVDFSKEEYRELAELVNYACLEDMKVADYEISHSMHIFTHNYPFAFKGLSMSVSEFYEKCDDIIKGLEDVLDILEVLINE